MLPGGMEWILIGLVILLLFGGRKVPELLRGLKKGISELNSIRIIKDRQVKDSEK
ncbi:MAG: twin-arginine translocase TatA/TatE family subunit [Bacteroidota bacterium]